MPGDGDPSEQDTTPDTGATTTTPAPVSTDDAPPRANPAPELRSAAMAAQGLSPQQAAQAAAIATRTGVSPQAVVGSVDQIKANNPFTFGDPQELAERHPDLAQWLTQPVHQAIAREDIPQLRDLSMKVQALSGDTTPTDPLPLAGAFKLGAQRSADSTVATLLAGPAWLQDEARKLFGITAPPSLYTPLGLVYDSIDLNQHMDEVRQTYAPSAMRDLVSQASGMAVDPTTVLLPAAGSALAIKATPVIAEALQARAAIKGAALIQGEVAGANANQAGMEERQRNPGAAANGIAAAANTAVQAALGYGLGKLGQEAPILRAMRVTPFTANPYRDLGSDIIRNAVTSGTLGAASGEAQDVLTQGRVATPEELAQFYASGAVPGALMSAANLHEAVIANHHLTSIRNAEGMQFGNKLLDAFQAAGASSAVKHSPEEVGKLVDAISQRGISNVYLQADEWANHFTAKGLDPVVEAAKAGLKDEYLRAKALGGDMQMPVRAAIGMGMDSDNPALLASKFRQAPNAPNSAEAVQFFQTAPEDLARAKAFASTQIEAARGANDAEGQTVYEERKAQLLAAGRSNEEADAAAKLHQRFFTTLADKFNAEQEKIGGKPVTATDLADEFRLRIQSATPDILDAATKAGHLDAMLDDLRTNGPTTPQHHAAREALQGLGLDPVTQSNDEIRSALTAKAQAGATEAEQARTAADPMGKPVVLEQAHSSMSPQDESLAFRDLLSQWRKANGDQTPVRGDKIWRELVTKSRAIDAANGKTYEQAAYHGSPHVFDQFTTDHMGKGEGNQAYGWGLYFAGEKEVAKYYRESLAGSQDREIVDGKPLADHPHKNLATFIFDEMQVGAKFDEARANALKRAKTDGERQWLESAKANDFKLEKPGRLYHVELPEGDRFLLWDQRLSEQPRITEILSRAPYFSDHGWGGDGRMLYSELQRPKVAEALGIQPRSPEAASKWMLGAGIKGIKYLDGSSRNAALKLIPASESVSGKWVVKDGYTGSGTKFDNEADARSFYDSELAKQSHNYVVFDGADVAIRSYEQRDAQSARGSLTTGDPLGSIIRLFQGANRSTIFHESGHYFLEVMGKLAERADAPQAIKDDFQKIMAWSGYGDRAGMLANQSELAALQASIGDRAPTPEEKARLKELSEPHETFARGFEHYLMEGVAPATGLRRAFARIKGWMKTVYQEIKNLGVPMNDDIRSVFDRMLASDKQIAAAKRRVADDRAFDDQASSGMSDAKWKEYERLNGEAQRIESEHLERTLMEAQRKGESEAVAEERAREREHVADEVGQQPVHQAIRALQDGETWDGRKLDAPIKIAKDDVERLLTPEEMRQLPGPGRERNRGRTIYAERKDEPLQNVLDREVAKALAEAPKQQSIEPARRDHDVVDALKTLGGIAPKGDSVGGEYDDRPNGFRANGALKPDVAAAQLKDAGHGDGTVNEMWRLVGQAMSARRSTEEARAQRARQRAADQETFAHLQDNPLFRKLVKLGIDPDRAADIIERISHSAKSDVAMERLEPRIPPAESPTTREPSILPADEAAPLFGFQSGHELLQAMIHAPDRERLTDLMTDERMQARHPDPMTDPQLMAAEADRSLHEPDIRGQLLEMERKQIHQLALDSLKAKGNAETAEAVDETQRKMQGQIDSLKAKVAREKSRGQDAKDAQTLIEAMQRDVANQALTSVRDERQTMRVAAREMIRTTKLANFDPDRFVAAERSSAIAFKEALAKRDYEKALTSKRAQMMNAELARAAFDAKEQAGKDQRHLLKAAQDDGHRRTIAKAGGWEWTVTHKDGSTKVYDTTDEHGKSAQEQARIDAINSGGTYNRSSGYLDQIDSLLERYDLKKRSPSDLRRRASLKAFLDKVEYFTLPGGEKMANGFLANIPEHLIEQTQQTHVSDMTVDDLHDLRTAVESLESMAKLKNQLLANKRHATLDAMVLELAGTKESKYTDGLFAENSKGIVTRKVGTGLADRPLNALGNFRDSLRQVSAMVYEMDGFKEGGPMWDAIMRPQIEASNREMEMLGGLGKRVSEAFAEWGKVKPLDPYSLNARKAIDGVPEPMNHWARIMTLMHYGNPEGRQRLMEGYGWNHEQIAKILSGLDASDIVFANRMSDILSAHWSDVKALEEKLNGIAPPKVEAIPVQLPAGTYKGGYMRLYYDGQSTHAVENMASEAVIGGMQGRGMRAMTAKGYTKERAAQVTGMRPNLDPGSWSRALNEMAHDLTHREMVLDQGRLYANKDFANAMAKYWGDGAYKQFVNQLKGIAGGSAAAQSSMGKVLEYLRQGANYSTRAFNVGKAVQQLAGLPLVVTRIPIKYLASSMVQHWTGPLSLDHTASWIHEQSATMRTRAATFDKNINDRMAGISMRGPVRKFMDAAGYYLWTKTFEYMDNVTWKAAYDEHMDASSGDHTKAVLVADQVMESLMGSGKQKDIPEVMRGGAVAQILTGNMSWALANWNQMTQALNRTHFGWQRLGDGGAAHMAKGLGSLAVLCVVGPMLWDWVRDELTPGKDMSSWTTTKGLATKVALSPVYAAMSSVPMLRDMTSSVLEGKRSDGPVGLRSMSVIADAAAALHQRRYGEATAKAAGAAAGTFLHLPSSALFQAMDGISYTQRHDTSVPQAAWYAANGVPKKAR